MHELSQEGTCTGEIFPVNVNVNWLSEIKASLYF